MTLSGTGALDATSPAFHIRRRNFPDDIYFFAPGLKRYETSEFIPDGNQRFVPISLTGTSCALQCDHCQGKLLESMRPAGDDLFDICKRLAARGATGVLVSGGADAKGRVPLARHGATLHRIKEELGLDVLTHTGLVDEAQAEALAHAGVDGAMLDIIGADETIRRVYHLDATVADYDRSLALLSQYGVPAMPHIVVGLHHGRLLGEWRALEIVASHSVAALVVVVIMPLAETPMAGIQPPPLHEVAGFLAEARLRLPVTPLLLGCARPAGPYKERLDHAAIEAGINGIAYPAEGTVEHARSSGLHPHFSEDCCSLLYKKWAQRP